MKLQAFHDASGLSRREGFVQGRHAVGVQIVQDDPDHGGVGIGCVHQPAHLVGEVLHGAAFGDGDVAPASPGFAEQEEVAGAAPAVLVVPVSTGQALASGSSRLGGQRFSHVASSWVEVSSKHTTGRSGS